jgi:NAD(P)-dependent dehydrogenase (short-subunit alcohol dehydrogenase family)
MAGRLQDKKVIVVGAGQTPGNTAGNGRAISQLFAREGAQVFCVDQDIARANETVSSIRSEGGSADAYVADITQASDTEGIARAGIERLGRVDVLVNNVGIGTLASATDGPVHHAQEHAYDQILAVNLKGMWLTTKAILPLMRAQRGGSIINISSMASKLGNNKIAYEISKAGVNRLTHSVASANAKYLVRCNALLLGLMDTPMAITSIAGATGKSPDEIREFRNKHVPMGKMGTAWDTAFAALFLASDEAKFVTGALLPVDGGMSTAGFA